MEIFIAWVIVSLFVGAIGSGKTIGFWGSFLLSVVLSPVIGFIILLFYPSKKHREAHLKEQQKQTAILQSMQAGNTSVADEIEKLKKQMESGILTPEEFQQMKTKLIEKI